MRDGRNDLNRVEVLAAAAPGTGDTFTAETVLGDFEALTYSVSSVATAAGTVTLQESDTSGSGFTDVAAKEVIGTQGVALVNGEIKSLGYLGSKEFVRAKINLSSDGVIHAWAEEGQARVTPNTTN